MAKCEVIPFGAFMRGELPRSTAEIIVDHVHRNKTVYRIAIVTVAALSIGDIAFAADTIDVKAKIIYKKLLSVGRWIIIIKGALDLLNNFVQGDYVSARKNVLSYALIYILLHSLPWMLEQIDVLFSDL